MDRSASAAGRDNENGVGLVTRGEVEEIGAGAKAVVGVVRAYLEIAGGYDEGLSGKECTEALAPRGGKGCGRVYVAQNVGLRPVRGHVFKEDARARWTVRADPDPVVRDGMILRYVRLGNLNVVHIATLHPVVSCVLGTQKINERWHPATTEAATALGAAQLLASPKP